MTQSKDTAYSLVLVCLLAITYLIVMGIMAEHDNAVTQRGQSCPPPSEKESLQVSSKDGWLTCQYTIQKQGTHLPTKTILTKTGAR